MAEFLDRLLDRTLPLDHRVIYRGQVLLWPSFRVVTEEVAGCWGGRSTHLMNPDCCMSSYSCYIVPSNSTELLFQKYAPGVISHRTEKAAYICTYIMQKQVVPWAFAWRHVGINDIRFKLHWESLGSLWSAE